MFLKPASQIKAHTVSLTSRAAACLVPVVANGFEKQREKPLANPGSNSTADGYDSPSWRSRGSCRCRALPRCVEDFFSARVPSSSAEVHGPVIHDIKEVEGVRQQEE